MKMTAGRLPLILVCIALLKAAADGLPLEESSSSLEDAAGDEQAQIVGVSDKGKENDGGGGEDSSLSRDKRTIGILRQVFPGLSQIVDRKIQMLTRFLFRFIGRLVLRGGAAGGGGGTTASSGDGGGRKIQITLPTFPPSVDDDEEEEDDSGTTTEAESTTAASPTTTTEASEAENSVSESKVSEVKTRARREAENDDQAADATGDNSNIESENELSSSSGDNESEPSDENPRNKRLLKFNLGGNDGSSGGGGGGGSGNFLFDIIRLVAGSGTTQEKDEAENAPLDDGNIAVGVGVGAGVDTALGKDDGYSAGVPGPLTRLFVIANRGISNLMQDLILRLAQTSERIVNFKARLITSII